MVKGAELSRTKKARMGLIVDKAYDMFIKNGIERTSMNDIADECNITRRTIYNYFDTKKALLQYLMNQKMEDVLEKHRYKKNFNISGFEDFSALLDHIFKVSYDTREEIAFIVQVKIILGYDKSEYQNTPFLQQIFLNYFRYYDDILERGLSDGSMSEERFEGFQIRQKTQSIFYCSYGYLSFLNLDCDFTRDEYNQNIEELKMDILRMVKII